MNTNNTKILFLDRDGTIIYEPDDFQVDSIEKIKLVPGVISSLNTLLENGYELVMVSNQDGMGTKTFPAQDFLKAHNYIIDLFESQGIKFKDIFICPHFKSDRCDCRKPSTGLLTEFFVKNNIDNERSYVIGDRKTDMELAKKLTLKGIQIDPYRVGAWKSIENDILSVDRRSKIIRETSETKISAEINLAVSEPVNIDTGIGFFDHMLEQLAKHADISIIIQCHGDLNIDEHHSVEDVALTLGQAFRQALGKKYGINRYGFTLPMDESIASVTLDLSGRPHFSFKGRFSREKVGGLPTELIPHFFQSLSQSLKASIHIEVKGDDNHHMIEACFKAFGRAFKQAISLTGNSLPSTKGVL